MGLFGFTQGDDEDDQELRENMDQIRDMVTNSASSGRAQPQQSQNSQETTSLADEQNDTTESEVIPPPTAQQSSSTEQPAPGPSGNEDNSDDLFVSVEDDLRPSKSSRTQEPSSGLGSEPDAGQDNDTPLMDTSDRQEPTEQVEQEPAGDTGMPDADDIPNAPEPSDPDPPEIERGPLFIRVEKFRQARRTVHGLHDLTEDIRTKVAGLKTTLNEDRETEEKLGNAITRLEKSVNQMKDILSP